MRLTESAIRRIINEEAKKVMREGEGSGGHEHDEMDPVGFLEMSMTHIEDLFKGGYDPDDAHEEAESMIADICFDMENVLRNWLYKYLKDDVEDDAMDRAEFARDMEEDR
jgi:hypothetical protein